MNPPSVYQLWFDPKETAAGKKPSILIRIRAPYVSAFKTKLKGFIGHDPRGVEKYVGRPSKFVELVESEYGYDGCVFFHEDEENSDGLYLCFELSTEFSRRLALTLDLTLTVLNILLREHEGETVGEEKQYVELRTMCHHALHGHSISGWVFPVFRKWLVKKGSALEVSKPFGQEIYTGWSFAPEARYAMQQAWRALSKPALRKYQRDCFVGLREDGRFQLSCFGNACDIGIYPDQVSGRESEDVMVEFDSHNLDTDVQQLTLIAGLTALVKMARKETP